MNMSYEHILTAELKPLKSTYAFTLQLYRLMIDGTEILVLQGPRQGHTASGMPLHTPPARPVFIHKQPLLPTRHVQHVLRQTGATGLNGHLTLASCWVSVVAYLFGGFVFAIWPHKQLSLTLDEKKVNSEMVTGCYVL